MRIDAANTAVRPVYPSAPAGYQTAYTAAAAPAQPSAYSLDQFVPSGYAAGSNVVYGQAKNMNLRILDKTLGLRSTYIESALIDKTNHNPMDIEEIDFNLHVQSAEVGVSDVDLTLTIEQLLRKGATAKGKDSPVKDLRVVFDPNNQIRVEGKVKALGMNLPFTVSGQVNVDTAGQIRYDLGKAKVAGLGVNGIMKTFGLSLEKLLKLNNPNDGYYTEGNSVYVNLGNVVTQQAGAPGLHATVRGVRTTASGQLQLLVGDTAADAQRAIDQRNQQEPAYVRGGGGHAYIDGFFLKEGQISIYDRTPGSPLNLNATGGTERAIKLHQGMVGVAEPRFQELIQDEIGSTDAVANLKTDLQPGFAKVSAKLFGIAPVSMHMTFKPTDDGRLMFEANKARVFGFIPVPDSFVGGQLQKLIKSGTPYGKGVALGQMSGMDLGNIKQVVHQDGYVVIESGRN